MAKVAIGLAIIAILPWLGIVWWVRRHRALLEGVRRSVELMEELYRALGYGEGQPVEQEPDDARSEPG